MTVFVLKLIAICAMLIDHTAAIFVPDNPYLYLAMRIIGRISFPIFCFLIVEGYRHTRNVRKYLIRLGCFAVISEIPFDLAFRGEVVYWGHQNVFFTLFIGLCVIHGFHEITERYGKYTCQAVLIKLIILFAGCLAAECMNTDYSALGVLMIVSCYVYENSLISLMAVLVFLNLFLSGSSIQVFALSAMIPIALYNGKKGPSMKYFFYAFYPGHLLILYLIYQFIRS